jgi:PIN domain nuclease of toxin-antitoxin system
VLEEERLSATAQEAFVDVQNEVFLSAASVWEISVKHQLGKLALPAPPGDFVVAQRKAHGIEALAMDEEAALLVTKLPSVHKDPFDRVLVSQALCRGLTILTPDPLIKQYPVNTLW